MQDLITARFAERLPALDLTAEGAAPADIQFMPPGRQTIMPTRDGKPVKVTVDVNAATADALQAALTAAAESGDRPWFDYNHEDGRASGHPVRFYWAGEDRKKGGVRCDVAWTQAGGQALATREFRHFSPAFFLAGEKVTGAPLNMGGLVNASAFRNREALWNKAASTNNEQRTTPMTEPTVAELQAKLIEKDKELASLQAKLAEVADKDKTITELKAKADRQEGELKAKRVEFAKATVKEAIAANRLAPQAVELHAKWEAMIEANSDNAALLTAIDPKALTGAVVKAGASGSAPTEPIPTTERWSKN